METINLKIKEYLAGDNLDFDKGKKLYEAHPSARRNVIASLKIRCNKPVTAEKLIYELEKLAGLNPSNRTAVIGSAPEIVKPTNSNVDLSDNLPYLEGFEYKIPYEALPESLQKLVIRKGSLYGELELKKKELKNLGTSNDDDVRIMRKELLVSMRSIVNEIKKHHNTLKQFDATKTVEPESEQIKYETKTTDTEAMDAEFHYKEMDYYQRKDLLHRLRSSVPKQAKKAENHEDKNVRKRNKEKAAKGRKMIAVLKDWLQNNKAE